METWEQVKKIQIDHDYSFVAMVGQEVYCSREAGIRPIMKLLAEDIDVLKGAIVSDRVIGRAAALLLAYAGIQNLYAGIMSQYGAEVLKQAGISFAAGKEVEYIVNRTGDGMCPMEQLVLQQTDPETAYRILKQKLQPS